MERDLEICIDCLFEEEQTMEKYFNLKPHTNREKKTADTVIKDFSDMQIGSYGPVMIVRNSKTVFEGELLKVLDNFKIFKDEELMQEACSVINNIKYADAGHTFDSGFNLSYDFVKTGAHYAKESLVLFSPSIMNDVSQYFVGYEMARALKDRNSDECTNVFTTTETIPTIVAMITAYETGDEKKIKLFFSKLKDNVLGYIDLYNKIINVDCSDEILANKVSICTQVMSGYLTSFYYSLALFEVYKFCPEVILEGISAVLKCEITTDELIETIAQALNITSFDELYKNGYEEFKLQLI